MRMFLIGMCDIFLILYLTSITNIQTGSILTVDDFYKLKTIHETLIIDQEKKEEEFEDKLRWAQKEKEKQLTEIQRQEELAAAQLKDLAGEKEKLTAKLADEKDRLADMEQSLLLSDVERERINRDLQENKKMLKAREQLLDNLNKEIADKEDARRKMEASYKNELASERQVVEEGRELAEKLQVEARQARRLADQMQEKVVLAYKTAATAKNIQEKAVILKEEALKDKEAAERKADEALAARQVIEGEKLRALKVMETANADKKKAERKVRMLAATIKEIKQDGETAYNKNIVPQLQKLNVTYKRKIANEMTVYKRKLALLPVKINGKIHVVFPSRQIGFTGRSDKTPDGLVIMYQGKKVNSGLINKDDDLISISLPGYEGEALTPYAADTKVVQYMPILLSLRNGINVSLGDKIRGISDDYFVVNREYLKLDKNRNLKFDVPGFRGTGTRGERIVRGDQLVDLNGRLIGVANVANRVIRIDTLSGWEEIKF